MVWVAREAFSWLLLLLQSRLVLLLQDDLLCNAAMQLLLRLTTAVSVSRCSKQFLRVPEMCATFTNYGSSVELFTCQVVMTARTRTQFPEAKTPRCVF